MSLEEYGPFGTVVTVALALIATFGLMLVKMFGRAKKWAWIAGEDAPFILTAGSRAVVVGVIAVTYLTINKTNYMWFGCGAILAGVVMALLLARFDRLRKLHVREVPIVAADGSQAKDDKGKLLSKQIVIGTEEDMRPDAKADYAAARKTHGGLSPIEFLAGYGAAKMYDPESCWTASVLSVASNRLTMLVLWIFVGGVLALYLASSAIEIYLRAAAA